MTGHNRAARFIHAFPKYLLLFTIFFLITIYILVWLIDFKQVYVPGLTEWKGQFPANLFWLQVFRERGIVENMQWLYLGLSFIICLMCVFLKSKQGQKMHLGFAVLSVGLLIMFLEDTVNVRHHLSFFLSSHFYEGYVNAFEWRTSTFRTLVEISVYGILGLLMIIAFVVIYHDTSIKKRSKAYLGFGYFFYGVAAVMSATRHIGDWYERAGAKVLELLNYNSSHEWAADSIFFLDPISFWFVDLLIEESLELIGAVFLLAAIISVVKNADITRQ